MTRLSDDEARWIVMNRDWTRDTPIVRYGDKTILVVPALLADREAILAELSAANDTTKRLTESVLYERSQVVAVKSCWKDTLAEALRIL